MGSRAWGLMVEPYPFPIPAWYNPKMLLYGVKFNFNPMSFPLRMNIAVHKRFLHLITHVSFLNLLIWSCIAVFRRMFTTRQLAMSSLPCANLLIIMFLLSNLKLFIILLTWILVNLYCTNLDLRNTLIDFNYEI